MNTLSRTVSVKLRGRDREFSAALAAFSFGLNIASAYAVEHQMWSNLKLHYALYHDIRKETGLMAQMTCSVFRHVAAAYKHSNRKRQNKLRSKVMKFRPSSMLLQIGRDWSILKSGELSISTLDGRVKVPFEPNRYTTPYFDGSWTFGAARLVNRRGKFYLSISCSKAVSDPLPADNIVGVDLGMNYLAVASNLENKAVFFGGGRVKNRNRHYLQVRKSLQTKGTRGAKALLRRLSGKQNRFQKDINHCVSKKIVQFAVDSGRSLIAFEDLTGIRANAKHRKEFRGEFHRWAFSQLRAFTTYKAEARELGTVRVNPWRTSQTDSRCGHYEPGQRKGHAFKCKACGFELHADLNASRNIAQRARINRQDLLIPGLPSIAPKAASVEDKIRKDTQSRAVASRLL